MNERTRQQIQFILELDQLKSVNRHNRILNETRHENTAEHSWHSILMAIIFSEYADSTVDLLKVIEMIAVHDIVEIYAGDTFFYDEEANKGKYEREVAAIEKLSKILPNDLGAKISDLWFEFEHQKTNDSIFANAVDQIMPVLLNANSNGLSWTENKITAAQVESKLLVIKKASPVLWEIFNEQVFMAKKKKLLY